MSYSTGDRAAEFTRLLNFFDQLASRGKKRQTLTEACNNATESPASYEPIHASVSTSKVNKLKDFYHATASLKTFGNLSNFPGYSGARAKQSRKVSGSELSVTESVKSEDDDSRLVEEEDAHPPGKFPMGRERPFTFKLMLHKLYGRDDWAKKVHEALEQSQKEYKPLSGCSEGVGVGKEWEVGGDGDGGNVDGAGGRDRSGEYLNPAKGRGEQTASSSWRQRSLSAATHSASNGGIWKIGDGRREMARAVKKRCIGRRKSHNGPLNASTQAGNPWVYDAMVSQRDHEAHAAERGSLRGKGRRRSLSVAEGGENAGGTGVRDRVRKRATTTVTATILEDVGRANLKQPAAG
ncbi:hypothetical protein FA13DRAFT_1790175 [Coprinellus micaceus]|uniref:Uncharacterized protein n=1 Tax=Coprinellus micaceus TaxID=71717 RepID=A0A4Y7TG15_COPMI|nr:hypothetical protein FA13DRAFT_1790175 [Coprinellus micaceus]